MLLYCIYICVSVLAFSKSFSCEAFWTVRDFRNKATADKSVSSKYLVKSLRAGSSDTFQNEEKKESSLHPTFLKQLRDEDDDSRTNKILIVMDGLCEYHGAYLIGRAIDDPNLANVVPVISDYLRRVLLMTEPEEEERWNSLRIPSNPQEASEWLSHFPKDSEIVAIYCESDSGLEEAEKLRELLNISCADEPIYLPARRDKFLMNERVNQNGLATANQKLCHSIDEASAFAEDLLDLAKKNGSTRPRVVVKPFRGVASESVYMCHSIDEVRDAWKAISSSLVFGSMNEDHHKTVLVQEFIEGVEYALDVVSRNGEHKIAAVWKYDKRPANGASFVYFQTQLIDVAMEPELSSVFEYTKKVLSALGIKYGLTHNEIIVTKDRGPVLVEVNCRQHNMDFCPLTMLCVGYNALDMTMDALTGNPRWDLYPSEPALRAFGAMVHLVNYETGPLSHVQHLDEISQLPSFFEGEVYEKFQTEGVVIEPTIDIRSDAGWIQIVNEDLQQLEADYKEIVKRMPTMFQVEDS